jgi:hypothetical protein
MGELGKDGIMRAGEGVTMAEAMKLSGAQGDHGNSCWVMIVIAAVPVYGFGHSL